MTSPKLILGCRVAVRNRNSGKRFHNYVRGNTIPAVPIRRIVPHCSQFDLEFLVDGLLRRIRADVNL